MSDEELIQAFYDLDFELVKKHLLKHRKDINRVLESDKGPTTLLDLALLFCGGEDTLGMVKWLLAHGASPHPVAGMRRVYPPLIRCISQYAEITSNEIHYPDTIVDEISRSLQVAWNLLIAYGANPWQPCRYPITETQVSRETTAMGYLSDANLWEEPGFEETATLPIGWNLSWEKVHAR